MWPVTQRSLVGWRRRPINHVLVTGQSLGLGAYGVPLLSTPRGRNWMFNGQRFDGAHGSFTGDKPGDGLGTLFERSNDIDLLESAGETIASGFAAYVTKAIPTHDLLMSNWARGSAAYALLARSPALPSAAAGSATYLRGLAQVLAARRRIGTNHQVRCVMAVHGESDLASATYDTDIRQWQVDTETDYFAMTGQSGRCPMFHTQISSWTAVSSGSNAIAVSPYMVLSEHVANPTNTTLVAPRYFLPHNADGLHLINTSYRWLGEYYAKAYIQQIINGIKYEPLRPTSVIRVNEMIQITFGSAVGQLVFDTVNVAPKNGTLYGFEYTDDTNPPLVSSVAITGTNKVRVTLASNPTGANKKIRYAYTGTPGNPGGPLAGPRGNLRDSDPAVGIWGESLYNWCVHFDQAIG